MQVAIGTLGTTLDRGEGPHRWSEWRPTLSLCQHEDFVIDRLELLCPRGSEDVLESLVADIGSVSPETEVRPHEFHWRDPWDFEEVYESLHDFARSFEFDAESHSYLVHITTGTHVAQICLFLLTESGHFPARLVQTAPPKRRGDGSPGRYSIIDLDLSRYDRIAQRFAEERQHGAELLKQGIATRNAAFNEMIAKIEHVAIHSSHPILLTGPTGSGKSSLARRIYELKKQRREICGRFVEVNCATLRGDAAMSTLFGHARGAFTGATNDRGGLLLEAHEGMVFLDELGELGLDEQAMLLRAIEEKRFQPLGTDSEVESAFQLICGTNRDLAASVREGRFRDDLLARVDLWSFELPGLRERREDIEPNVHYELAKLTASTGRAYRFNQEALRHFLEFATARRAAWCGNFRDLNASLARLAVLAPSGRITRSHVEEEIARLESGWLRLQGRSSDIASRMGDPLDGLIDDTDGIDSFDLVQLRHVIEVCLESRSLSDAGRTLFAASRARRKKTNDADRLRKYLARFGLDWARVSG